MAKKKSFLVPLQMPVSVEPFDNKPSSAVVEIGWNATAHRRLDFSSWIGLGIDEWVWAFSSQLRAILLSGVVSPATVVTYGTSGIPKFFEFLTNRSHTTSIEELDTDLLKEFLTWLKNQGRWNFSSQKGKFNGVKAVLIALQQRGVVPGSRDLFPANPFPLSNHQTQGEVPLSLNERDQFVAALRDDIVLFHKGKFEGPDREALVLHMLALALRTGINKTPLLELRRDCLSDHPFLPTMKILKSYKRRGKTTHLKNLRGTQVLETPSSIPMDGVGLLNLVLKHTEPIARDAPKNLRDSVWLYVPKAGKRFGKATAINSDSLQDGINAFVNRNHLHGDDGKPLRLNMQRLRKTMENRLFSLSGGDLFTTAKVMGHSPQVADTHYLSCTAEMKRDATFVGEALAGMYREGGIQEDGSPHSRHSYPNLEVTPVGSCTDSLHGQKAPKNGTHCSDFLSCFSCSNYAIVGAVEDLHRLFSFYWHLDSERRLNVGQNWTARYVATMALIDSFTMDKFDHATVAMSKRMALEKPIAFWRLNSPRGDAIGAN